MRETRFWTWHLLAGIAILIFGGLHMIVMHLDGILGWFNPAGGSALDWANVVVRSQGFLFPVVYIILLGVTLFHGFYGLRNILLELGIGRCGRVTVNILLVGGGIVLFTIGAVAAIKAMGV